MQTLKDFQKEIHNLTKKSNYTEALSFFKKEKIGFNKYDIASNVFLVSDMLKCMRMTDSHAAAAIFLSVYDIKIDMNTEKGIIVAWALVLYDWYKKLTEKMEPIHKTFIQLLNDISSLLPILKRNETPFAKDFYNTIVLKVLKTETKRNNIQWNLLLQFCELVDPEHLSTDCYEVVVLRKGVEKNAEMASVKEEWYVQYSKSLFINEKYEKCIEVCETALNHIEKLHYSNDIWFERRIAQCHNKLGNLETSKSIYEKLIRRKDDWYILAELGEIYKNLKLFQSAKEIMQTAMIKFGDLSFKVDLIENLGHVYENLGESSLSKDHFTLAALIRTESGWRVSEQLLSKVSLDFASEDIKRVRTELIKKLENEWQRKSKSTDEIVTLKGEIVRVSSPKPAGVDIWIKAIDGKQYYSFVKNDNDLYVHIMKGVKVSFQIKTMPGKPLDRAIKLKLEV